MNFLNNFMAKAKATTTKAAQSIENAAKSINTDKIKWISIEKIVIDPELKGIYKQEEKEIVNISEDMKINDYNPANPLTLGQDNVIVDGHTRYLAALRAGLKKVAVIYKHFDSRQEMLSYAYAQQLNRRNLSDSEIFLSYQKLKALTDENGKKAKTDVEIAEQLQISPRQVAKMKEVEKKASSETMDKIISGETTVNKVYNEIKASEKTIVQKDEVVKNEQENNSVETKSKKISKKLSNNPNFEKLCLKLNTEDFTLIQKAAEKDNLSISEYATKILLNTVSKSIV
jgi:ParB family chromosome partitioning protein